MKEMVLYYTPTPMPHTAKLKSVLVQMGVRIKNIASAQLDQKVGYLAGLPGFEEMEDQKTGELSDIPPNPRGNSGHAQFHQPSY